MLNQRQSPGVYTNEGAVGSLYSEVYASRVLSLCCEWDPVWRLFIQAVLCRAIAEK